MNSGRSATQKDLRLDSFHDFRSFGKDVVRSVVFKKTEAFANNSADMISEKVRLGANEAEERMKEFSAAALRFVKENPFYVATGAAFIGLAWGAYLLRKRR